MLVSLFTPTHNPSWLHESYQSLRVQSYTQWEWVLVPNGGAQIPIPIQDDPRVKVYPAPDSLNPGIGPLKRYACQKCQGELLVELDHDDLLTRNALEVLVQNARRGIGFQYSDFVNFYSGSTPRKFQAYDRKLGWPHPYLYIHEGQSCIAVRDFEPSPSALSNLTFAPNHVRAWTRQAYDAAGGHDETLSVVDDYDLICKTFLTGAEFIHIPEVLYLYRLHGKNTWQAESDKVSQLRTEISRRYLYPIIDEWCRRFHYYQFQLGPSSGPGGYPALNWAQVVKTQEIRQQGIRVPDRSVGCIRAYDFLQYLAPSKVGIMMQEFYRVLAPGGWLLTYTPSTDGLGAFADPSFVSLWNQDSFASYSSSPSSEFRHSQDRYFKIHRIWDEFPSQEHRCSGSLYVRADLVALKGQPEPMTTELLDGTHIAADGSIVF